MLDKDLWLGTTIAAWDNFAKLAADAASEAAAGKTILFRGQSNGWQLRPGLVRAVPVGITPRGAEVAEKNALDHFRSQAHLHDGALRLSSPDGSPGFLEWWALMQHHGAPTRLLDWTASPYVAAYFAAERDPTSDGVILVIDADAIETAWLPVFGPSIERSHFFGVDQRAGIKAYTPYNKTTRLSAQQGYFTVATRPLDHHDELLAACGAIRRRWIVPAAIKSSFLVHLRTMNVTAQSLFPGLDGLGRSAGDLIRTART